MVNGLRIRFFAAVFSVVCPFLVLAVDDTADGVFDERFRTLQIAVENAPMGYPPVIGLYSDDRLVVSFDELANDRSYLRYSVVHCNADWQPSTLVDTEFLDGFNEGTVEEWDFSRATSVAYVHYRIVLPDGRFRFKVSGNYLLRVYREENADDVLLQVRFMVNESTASVTGNVDFATDIDYRDAHQQVNFAVEVSDGAMVEDLFNDLKVTVTQNGRTDNERKIGHPLRAVGKTAVYEHLRPLIFTGGNNYRRFETVSVTVPSIGVDYLGYEDPYYHAVLQTDISRKGLPYLYDLNLHGNYLVSERDSSEPDVDADYVVTHFSLESPRLQGKSVFIDSDFVNRRFNPESLMLYNEVTGRYERTLLLKQGAYSYQYLCVPDGQPEGSTADIEGNRYPTRNRYLIKVYHRRRTERYDRLIAVYNLEF